MTPRAIFYPKPEEQLYRLSYCRLTILPHSQDGIAISEKTYGSHSEKRELHLSSTCLMTNKQSFLKKSRDIMNMLLLECITNASFASKIIVYPEI